MKVAPLITVALVLCIACPGIIQAKKKFCIGKNGNKYAVGNGYVDMEGEVCISYKCVKRKKNKKVFMKETKCDCEWSDWSSWSACAATNGNATRTRARTCSNPPPCKGGNQCSGPEEEIEECSLPSCSCRPGESVNVTALELSVESLNASMQTLQTTMQSVLELMTTMQSTADKQGTCMMDLSSSDCPDSAPGKIGVVDGIHANKAGVTSTKTDINTNKAGINTNKAEITSSKADINTNKAGINTNKAGINTNKAEIMSTKADINTNQADINTNKDTIAEHHPGEYLVVTSGITGNHGYHEYPLEVEIITEHGVCNHSIPNFPVKLNQPESAYMKSKFLMTCGDELDTPSLEEWKAPCYKLDKSGTNWVQGASMIKGRHTMTMTKVGEVLFAFGHHNVHQKEHIEKYSNNAWEELSSPLIRTRLGQCTVLYKNTLTIIGGRNPTTVVEQLDLTTMTVSSNTLPNFPINKLYDHACIVLQEDGEDVIYVTGGRLGHPDNGQRKVWKYNGGDKWELDGEMNLSRYHHTMGVLAGKLVVVGGSTQFWATPTGSIEIREKNGKWRELVSGLSMPRLMHAMSLIPSTNSGIFSCTS